MPKTHTDLHIRLEGRLETVEALTEHWRAVERALSTGALPSESTLRALRAAEADARDAVDDTSRVSEAHAQVDALRRARQQFGVVLRERLLELGIPAPASGSPVHLLDAVLELGAIEVLDLIVHGARPPETNEPSLILLWGGYSIASRVLASVPEFALANTLAGGALVSYSLFRFLRWLRYSVQPSLSSRTLFVRNATPIDLSSVEWVGWPGATLDPTDLEFHLKDGRVVTLSFRPNATLLLERLRALGVRVEPPGRAK